MENKLLKSLEEMESINFKSLEEALKQYSKKEIFDTWLKYEGIIGYTSHIYNAINKLYDLDIK